MANAHQPETRKRTSNKWGRILLVVGILVVAFSFAPIGVISHPSVAHASYDNEPFESENYYAYGGRKDGTFSLTYLGQGGGKCDSNDYRFRVNVNRSYAGSDWKYYSNNSYYRRNPTGRPIYGFQLGTPNAHICIGYQEFQWWLHPNSYWTTSGVQQNIYTWRR